MDKQEFINKISSFLTNLELEYIDIYGQLQKVYIDKLLKTNFILLNDLPFDLLEKIFYTKIEFYKITNEYFRIVTKQTKTVNFFKTEISYKSELVTDKPEINNLNFNNSNTIFFKEYDKIFLNNTYLKYNDYFFFKKYFNLDISNIDIYYPVKITNKKDFKELENIFNVTELYYTEKTANTDIVTFNNNEIIDIKKNLWYYGNDYEIYNNYYYTFYENCSLFNIIKYFIYGLLQYKQTETNTYNNIPLEKTDFLKTDENIDKTVAQNMINRIEYNTINKQELIEELQPIPTDEMYANEQHIILQGIFEDIQKFCNNIEKYIAGANWLFDKTIVNELETIDDKINYLETVLNTYNKNKLDLRGYNSKYVAVKRNEIVGDSDNLNYLNLTETENNFLHIEKMLQSNKYPLFAKLNLIAQIKQSILLYLDTIKNLAENKKFYNEQTTEELLPELRQTYDRLAKAVASQEQPGSFGNPSYNGNPNEYPFEQERP